MKTRLSIFSREPMPRFELAESVDDLELFNGEASELFETVELHGWVDFKTPGGELDLTLYTDDDHYDTVAEAVKAKLWQLRDNLDELLDQVEEYEKLDDADSELSEVKVREKKS